MWILGHVGATAGWTACVGADGIARNEAEPDAVTEDLQNVGTSEETATVSKWHFFCKLDFVKLVKQFCKPY